MEVLSAYVREHAPRSMCFSAAPTAHPTADVQPILTVIGQRDKNRALRCCRLPVGGDHRVVNVDLINANFTGANLTNAGLFGVKQFERCGDQRTAAVSTG